MKSSVALAVVMSTQLMACGCSVMSKSPELESVDVSIEIDAPAPPAKPKPLVIVAGGDVNLGRDAGQMILASPSYDPLRHIAGWLRSADYRFINLESPLSEQNGQTESPYHHLVFTGPPRGADVLADAGIDIVSLANNHAWDYGRRGFRETLQNLERAGVAYTGASVEPNKHYAATSVRVDGWSIAFFAVTQIWNIGKYRTHPGNMHIPWANHAKLKAPLADARQHHDLVLFSFHGGVEYRPVPYPPARRFIDTIMADGVDVLMGHHPHVPRGIAWQQTSAGFGRPAFHSLGNLVFDRRSDERWERTSYLVRMTFHRSGERQFELCPYNLRGHEPFPHHGDLDELREHIAQISEPFGGTRFGEVSDDGCVEVLPPT